MNRPIAYLNALTPLVIWVGFEGLACPPAPLPPPQPPDASDGAAPLPQWDATPPSPLFDAPLPPLDCARACGALQAAGCSLGNRSDCDNFLLRDLSIGRVSNAATGRPLTCADIAQIRTRADAVAMGFLCR